MNTTFTKKLPFFTFLIMFLSFFQAHAFELVCPDDITVDCDAELWDLSCYGNAKYHDYSGWHDAGEPTVQYNLNNCNLGYITRTWSVYNPYACAFETCSQKIKVQNLDFNGNFINWPKTGLELTGCNPNLDPNSFPPGYQKPTWNAPSCSMIGVSYKDKIFTFGGACKKLVRTWTVIDCCDFNPYDGHGMWNYNQEIDITVSDVPQVICPADIEVESASCEGIYVEVPNIEIPNSECSENVVIMNDSPYANSNENASGVYPIGTTQVTFTADYGCWQKTMCTIEIKVLDKTAPTPYCMYGLSIALMGMDTDNDGINDEGMAEIWASDFDLGSYDKCNPGSLKFSFSSDVNDNVRVFNCDHVGRNDVEMWVTDQDGNQNYCSTYVKVQNNAANIEDCEDNDNFSTVQGSIVAHYGDGLDNVDIKATGTSHEFEIVENLETVVQETVVDSIVKPTGVVIYMVEIDTVEVVVNDTIHEVQHHYAKAFGKDYGFEYLPHYYDYVITGKSQDEDKEFINKADIVYIQDYINGDREFNFYQKMAADVNKDGAIDNLDIELLTTLLATNTAWEDMDDNWHFYDASMNMDNMEEGHECEEFCRLNDLKNDTYKVNLKGYRIGDVTNAVMSESDDKDLELTIERRTAIHAKVDIQPNPFVNTLQVSIDSPKDENTQFVLMNTNGQVILTQNVSLLKGNQLMVIKTDNLPNGVYHYSVKMDNKNVTGKVVKID